MSSTTNETSKRITICVLVYGDHFDLARQVIDSIVNNCDRDLYSLYVGCNECCQETLDFVQAVKEIDRVFVSDVNINKCPMQRRMFAEVDTEYVWWFDDDSFIEESDAMQRRLEIADLAAPTTVLWGPVFYWNDQAGFNFGVDVEPWVRRQAWFSCEPIPCDVSGKWVFIIGGAWFARTSIIQKLDWPPKEFIKAGDDALFCEAIRQSGYTFKGIGECGVRFQVAPRRAPETKEMMQEQMGPERA